VVRPADGQLEVLVAEGCAGASVRGSRAKGSELRTAGDHDGAQHAEADDCTVLARVLCTYSLYLALDEAIVDGAEGFTGPRARRIF
jgi:hypothetical protein